MPFLPKQVMYITSFFKPNLCKHSCRYVCCVFVNTSILKSDGLLWQFLARRSAEPFRLYPPISCCASWQQMSVNTVLALPLWQDKSVYLLCHCDHTCSYICCVILNTPVRIFAALLWIHLSVYLLLFVNTPVRIFAALLWIHLSVYLLRYCEYTCPHISCAIVSTHVRIFAALLWIHMSEYLLCYCDHICPHISCAIVKILCPYIFCVIVNTDNPVLKVKMFPNVKFVLIFTSVNQPPALSSHFCSSLVWLHRFDSTPGRISAVPLWIHLSVYLLGFCEYTCPYICWAFVNTPVRISAGLLWIHMSVYLMGFCEYTCPYICWAFVITSIQMSFFAIVNTPGCISSVPGMRRRRAQTSRWGDYFQLSLLGARGMSYSRIISVRSWLC